jgi:cystathionine gamma-synthase
VSVVDATWSTPYLLNPLAHGADFVMHSITKYICGHSDVLGGAVTASKASATNSSLASAGVLTRLRTVHQIGGGVLGPWECWMAMRGLRTLPVRMKQHSSSAMQLAERLERHERVTRVFYPGLASHPQYEIAAVQYDKNRFGGMMSILVKPANPKSGDGAKEALAVSQQSNVIYACTMSHAVQRS